MDLIKMMLQRIGGKDAGDARVKAAAQQGADARFLELLPIGPLPLVFKLGGVQGLVVGGVHIMGLCGQAGVHDGQVLIGQGQVEHHIGLIFFDESDQLVHLVGVHLLSVNLGLGGTLQFFLQLIALALGAAGDDDLIKNLAVLAALMNGYAGHAAAADDHAFSHGSLSFSLDVNGCAKAATGFPVSPCRPRRWMCRCGHSGGKAR